MVRSISRMVLVAVCVAALAGCGSGVGVGGVGSPSQRSARATCRDHGVPDYLIDSAFTLARIDQDAGYSASQVIQGSRQGCAVGDAFGGGCITNPNVGVSITMEECIQECMSCLLAIVDEVYGIQ